MTAEQRDSLERIMRVVERFAGRKYSEDLAILRAMADPWPGEVCKRCHRRNTIGFNVSDEIWDAVSGGRFLNLCATCFDELAQAAGVAYQFESVHPISWSSWTVGTTSAASPR